MNWRANYAKAWRGWASRRSKSQRAIHERCDDDGEVLDRFSVHEPEATSVEGYRLIWYYSTRKAELDMLARHKRVERALAALAELQEKLSSPRTRYRDQVKVTLSAGVLIVSGEAPLPREVRDARIHRLEIPHGHFQRRIELPPRGSRYPAGIWPMAA